MYKIDADGTLTVLTDQEIDVDTEDESIPLALRLYGRDHMGQFNQETQQWQVGVGKQLIVPWAGPNLRYARGPNVITELAEGVDKMEVADKESEDVEMDM